ncbi:MULTISPECIES: LptM family lipoprotein [Tenebrionibacter/Tenebrionicola group]|jgi:predicted small lipoprotein YifL|uniref:Lipoprotein n=2 Tax=Tenebrionibacter/Tenebrionicola group TaxID=2969848 RepID=A0A8K0V9Y7_9ENTR|nr:MULTISPECIES: hypothetical protein [Tenebrionibacter/Tenebrionicola group]MBK4717027.1 hypothetical protein [Tenebrionibacter intestinalis]MBV4414404.1 hypothetical protein [Tenebrionicola larvae]MBV5095306.1 hypothetical protein [Tenebrionicola larvae]
MKKLTIWLTAIAMAGALTGCARTAPITQVHTTIGTGHTQDQVKKAILKAGAERQWIMAEAGPGLIKARQQSRGHDAVISIPYSATGYDIKYADSRNLRAGGGKIHKAYNRWVRNLDKDIQLNLSAGANL